jgi:hypothetical protein
MLLRFLSMYLLIEVLAGCIHAAGGVTPTPPIVTAPVRSPVSAPSPLIIPSHTATPHRIPTSTLIPSPTSMPRPVPTATLRITPTSGSQPCQQPPDDYRRVKIGEHIVNARTWWMLNLAKSLYTGRGNPLAIVQGSYVDNLLESFGTHAGGGAVDISVRVKASPSLVLSNEEMAQLVAALRQAGFAAWARLPGDLNPPAPLHIHAIAVGDRELSDAARRQLDGPEGYFRGLNGVPPEHGGSQPDRYGGPVVCGWMLEAGYEDLR